MALRQKIFGDFSKGMNVVDDPHFIRDDEVILALNVDFVRGAAKTRSGIELFNEDATKTGGITMMLPFYDSTGAYKQLIFTHDDDYYYLTAAATPSTAWGTIGDYGTAGSNPRGYIYNNLAILGSGVTGNNLKKWTGAAFSSTATEPTDKVNIFEHLQTNDFSALMAAREGTSTLYWCDTDDPEDWTTGIANSIIIGKNDGEQIRGLKVQGDYLWVFKDTKKYSVQISYDDITSTYLPKVTNKVDKSGGTAGHDSIQVVTGGYGDDLHILSRKGEGVQSFGRPANFSDSPIAQSVSQLINPIVDKINWNIASQSRAIVWNRKYMLACAYESSPFNNVVFVRDLDGGGWSLYDNWKVGSWAIFKDSDGIEQLFFGDALNPRIYKLNPNVFSDNLNEYSRELITKKYDSGTFDGYKEAQFIDIVGTMQEITELFVTVIIDNTSKRYKITADNIISRGLTDYIGDTFIGDSYIGGLSNTGENLYLARLPIDNDLRVGRVLQFGFNNSGKGQSWSVTGISIVYEDKPVDTFFPDKYYIKTLS